jgi:hypothetical protein
MNTKFKGVREMSTRLRPVVSAQWGPDWEGMSETAEFLGSQGIMFEIKTPSAEDEARGVDIMPELILYDNRFRKHIVTFGLWVVVHSKPPNHRGAPPFRVVDHNVLAHEYIFTSTESESE